MLILYSVQLGLVTEERLKEERCRVIQIRPLPSGHEAEYAWSSFPAEFRLHVNTGRIMREHRYCQRRSIGTATWIIYQPIEGHHVLALIFKDRHGPLAPIVAH